MTFPALALRRSKKQREKKKKKRKKKKEKKRKEKEKEKEKEKKRSQSMMPPLRYKRLTDSGENFCKTSKSKIEGSHKTLPNLRK